MSYCPHCKTNDGPHFVPPCFHDPGFFSCMTEAEIMEVFRQHAKEVLANYTPESLRYRVASEWLAKDAAQEVKSCPMLDCQKQLGHEGACGPVRDAALALIRETLECGSCSHTHANAPDLPCWACRAEAVLRGRNAAQDQDMEGATGIAARSEPVVGGRVPEPGSQVANQRGAHDAVRQAVTSPPPSSYGAQESGGSGRETRKLADDGAETSAQPSVTATVPAPSPAAPEAWPSAAAASKLYDCFHDALRHVVHEFAIEYCRQILKTCYAIDRPAIEAAARERGVREFANWLEKRSSDEVLAAASKGGAEHISSTLADRFLATHGRPA